MNCNNNNNNNNNNNKAYTPFSEKCSQLRVFISRCHMNHIIQYLHQQTPKYRSICDLFHWYTPTRALRSAFSISLVVSRSKTVSFYLHHLKFLIFTNLF